MKRSPDNQINASLFDILRIKWLVFYCGCLSSAQLDRWQAPKQWSIIDQHLVEQTAYRRDVKDNGYESVFTNSWLVRQRNMVVDKEIRQKSTKEWTHSLTAVPFVRGHRTVSPRIPRNTCVWCVDTAPGQKNRIRVNGRPPIRGWKQIAGLYGIRYELVNRAVAYDVTGPLPEIKIRVTYIKCDLEHGGECKRSMASGFVLGLD